jgi:C1A family cysteine protease
VRNQGSCGSCYSFAAVAALEGAYFVKTGSVLNFAEQQPLDCSGSYGNAGCGGGLMTNVYNYLKYYKMMQESSYRYVGYLQSCKYNSAVGVFNTRGYVNLPANDPNALMNALVLGPVSVAVQANSYTFQFYKSGIISSTACGTSLNHGVTAVGYGTENGMGYWIVRNSWGPNWGEGGYFRVMRDMISGPGICGINKMNSYPLL